MNHSLPKLLYGFKDLEPYIDARTMEIHYTKHHQNYINKLNEALQKHPGLFDKSAEELISNLDSVPEDIRMSVRNNGGGHVNHSLFWEILSPQKESATGAIEKAIEKTFGSFVQFKEKFSNSANTLFGSGWTWLVVKDGRLEIVNLPGHDSPLAQDAIPILVLDMWEHAYYIKYQNRKSEYISAFFNIINWKKVNELYEKSIK